MTPSLHFQDLLSISPLLILLFTALLILLFETLLKNKPLYFAPIITSIGILAALGAVFASPQSHNPLLTPWLRFDLMAKLFNSLFLFIGMGSTLLAITFFKQFKKGDSEYYFLLLSSLFGLLLIGSSADFLNLFLGLEILSISLYIWCGYIKSWKLSGEAAMKYFLMGALSTSFFIYGVALIYGATGSTQFSPLLQNYQEFSESTNRMLFLAGTAFITLGLAFKAAIVPFHSWAPDVYDGSPTPITAFMATGTKLGAFAAIIIVFSKSLPNFDPLWNQGIALLAYPTLIYANLVALKQTQLRRFFAYSGISHAGFALIPIAAGTPDSLSALLFYLIVYMIATLGAFSILSLIDKEGRGVMLDDLKGLFYRAPLLTGIFTICLLTLGGIPPTAGFFAKLFIFKVAFESGYYLLVFVGLLVSILSAFYYIRIVGMTLSRRVDEENKESVEALTFQPCLFSCFLGGTSLLLIVGVSCFPGTLMSLLAMIGG
jgi:NADH-quinone oxidoreductase subunit N